MLMKLHDFVLLICTSFMRQQRLEAQRVGLSHLNGIVKKDARDLAIMGRPHKALDVATTAGPTTTLALTRG